MNDFVIYPWQKKQWSSLAARWEKKCWPHALLLLGQAGLGKVDFALALANLLLQPSNNLLQAGTHPDFLLVQPEEDSKNISIDQIRAISDMLNNHSHQGGYQVVIINPASNMSIAAGNALLKTLEEPPGQAALILISDNLAALSATIRSRCQIVKFYPPSREESLSWLAAKSGNSDIKQLETALRFAQDSPLTALSLLDTEKNQQITKLQISLEQLLAQKIDYIEFAQEWQDLDLKTSLDFLQIWLMDLIKSNLKANRLSQNKLITCINKVLAAKQGIANNLNKQLVFEDIGAELTC